jgi:hypothetical protein
VSDQTVLVARCVALISSCLVQEGRFCLVTELMDRSLYSALLLPDDENLQYQYYNQ